MFLFILLNVLDNVRIVLVKFSFRAKTIGPFALISLILSNVFESIYDYKI